MKKALYIFAILLTLALLALPMFAQKKTTPAESQTPQGCCCEFPYKWVDKQGSGYVYADSDSVYIASTTGVGQLLIGSFDLANTGNCTTITLTNSSDITDFVIVQLDQGSMINSGGNLSFGSSVVDRGGTFSEGDIICIAIDNCNTVAQPIEITGTLTQSGTSDPTINIFSNTTTVTPVIVRIGDGSYEMAFNGINYSNIYFTFTNSAWVLMPWQMNMKVISYGANPVFAIWTSFYGTTTDGLLQDTPFRIQFYP